MVSKSRIPEPLQGAPAFAFFSHRVLRMLVPFLLLAAFAANFMLAGRPLYAAILACQFLFYSMAAIGYRLRLAGKRIRLFAMPLQFCLMNTAYIFGLARYLSGRQAHTWKVTPRESFAAEPVRCASLFQLARLENWRQNRRWLQPPPGALMPHSAKEFTAHLREETPLRRVIPRRPAMVFRCAGLCLDVVHGSVAQRGRESFELAGAGACSIQCCTALCSRQLLEYADRGRRGH